MDGYTEAEIIAARGAASYVFTIETPEGEASPLAGQVPAGSGTAAPAVQKELAVEPGMGVRLDPGEKWETHVPSRPNTALDQFMRYMLREFCAGTGPSYESVSRDYSQSNYSSSRLALLDDRDLWKMLQQWWLRSLRLPVHKEWLQAAVLSRTVPAIRIEEYATDPKKFEAVLFKPRGWSWVDPTKEVAAYKEAVKAGFITVSDVISQTGNGLDLEDVLTQRERELKMMEEKGLMFDTSPEVYVAEEKPAPVTTPPKEGTDPPDKEDEDSATNGPPKRAVSIVR
jgi:lambda family phage portal protein